jgi:hypothetical protein
MLATAAVLWIFHVPAPDVLIGSDGRSFAVRGAVGQ